MPHPPCYPFLWPLCVCQSECTFCMAVASHDHQPCIVTQRGQQLHFPVPCLLVVGCSSGLEQASWPQLNNSSSQNVSLSHPANFCACKAALSGNLQDGAAHLNRAIEQQFKRMMLVWREVLHLAPYSNNFLAATGIFRRVFTLDSHHICTSCSWGRAGEEGREPE